MAKLEALREDTCSSRSDLPKFGAPPPNLRFSLGFRRALHSRRPTRSNRDLDPDLSHSSAALQPHLLPSFSPLCIPFSIAAPRLVEAALTPACSSDQARNLLLPFANGTVK